MPGSIASHLHRTLGRLMRVRPADLGYRGGAVSFTFDDFPRSALEAGGAILERYGLRGTYYAALGLAGGHSEVGPIASLAEMRETHARGHELACHTYSHLDCSRAGEDEIIADLRRNAEAVAALGDGVELSNFAYPFGRYLFATRQLLAPRFASCRGTKGGINGRGADLADLRGTRIYHSGYSESALARLIERNRSVGGWLIFYTHDVSDAPSPWGCTPGELEAIVAYAAERSAVMPVHDFLAGPARLAA